MKCSEVKYYLNDYSKGMLLDELRYEIHDHLCICKTCTKSLDEFLTLNSEAKKRKIKTSPRQIIRERSSKSEFELETTSKSFLQKRENKSKINFSNEEFRSNLIMKAQEIENNKLLVITGILSTLALGIILAFLIFDSSTGTYWSVENISGYPVIESRVLAGNGIIKSGEKLFTNSESRARLKLGDIGEIDIEPLSEVQFIETETSEHKLILSRGQITFRTWDMPKLFSINTPSSDIKDFKATYTVNVSAESSTKVQVNSGYVMLSDQNRKSLLIAGTTCISKMQKGPGTPYASSASNSFIYLLNKIDFEADGLNNLDLLLSESRKEDIISLFYLLRQNDSIVRGKIFDRIIFLSDMPQKITREEIMNGDKDLMARLWIQLGLGSISVYQNL